MPSLRGHRLRRGPAVAGQHHDAACPRRAAAIAPARVALIGSATASSPAGRRPPRRASRSAPSRRSASAQLGDRRRIDPQLVAAALGCRAPRAVPSTVPVTPLPGVASEIARLDQREAALARRRATIAAASGCSLPRSRLAASRSSSLSSTPAAATTSVSARLALGQRAGLVDDQRVDPLACVRAPRRSRSARRPCAAAGRRP